MEIRIHYSPHPKQQAVHESTARFKIVAAGRRSGKTTLAVNEIIKAALSHPQETDGPVPRSWFMCATYRQAEMIGWRTFLRYLPEELIKSRNVQKLQIELINGHVIEFKGTEDPDKLRGVPLCFAVLDEYGFMDATVWTEVIRASLVDMNGKALFIGTPGHDGSPHFYELYQRGLQDGKMYQSWLFHTVDNPIKEIQEDANRAKTEMPPDIYRREFEADFSITAGLIYDNFRPSVHVIPHYEPDSFDFVVGSIDPGLNNPTGALLVAWDREGRGRIFKEYYEKDRLAGENAKAIADMAAPYRPAYWVIDRASTHRDQISGMTVYSKYNEFMRPLITASNDPGSVWAGIDEVKKLLHVDPKTAKPRLYVCNQLHWTQWEMTHYTRYKRKWHVDKNEEERPRKLNDHLCDCLRNMVMTKPWIRPTLKVFQPAHAAY